jgi:hypothetical protein
MRMCLRSASRKLPEGFASASSAFVRSPLRDACRRGASATSGCSTHPRSTLGQRACAEGGQLSARSAWALLLLLEGRGRDVKLHRSERARATARAARAQELEPGALSARARTLWRFAHPAALARIADDARVVQGGEAAAEHHHADLLGGAHVELYAREEDVSGLERDFALRPVAAADANLKLRIPNGVWPFRPGERIAPRTFIAADLIDDGDERSVRAGRALLAPARQVSK